MSVQPVGCGGVGALPAVVLPAEALPAVVLPALLVEALPVELLLAMRRQLRSTRSTASVSETPLCE